MERLLVLRLRSVGCSAEARLNDIPVARTPAGGGMVSLPVHEFMFEGPNDLSLTIEPGAAGAPVPPRLALDSAGASLRLLLPRVGHLCSETVSRTLAEVDWMLPDGEIYLQQQNLRGRVELPIKFPRWRWLDMPPIGDVGAVQPLVAAFVQAMAIALAKGDADSFAQAARLRFEELALAYQQPVADLVARWRSRIQLLHATKALRPLFPAPADVLLRPCAGGRLLECLAAGGEPALRTEPGPDGSSHAWPIRVTVVDGRCHIVR